MKGGFRFDLEPELERRREARDAQRRRVDRARRIVAVRAWSVEKSRDALRAIEQRIREARDDRLRRAADRGDVEAAAAHLDGLARLLAGARARLGRREDSLRTAGHQLELAEEELRDLESARRALERLRERRERAWRGARERRAESRRDDDAVIAWWHSRED
ncbi:MAG: hypothetical protein R3F20_13595 [Planctomycetota bacterium]